MDLRGINSTTSLLLHHNQMAVSCGQVAGYKILMGLEYLKSPAHIQRSNIAPHITIARFASSNCLP